MAGAECVEMTPRHHGEVLCLLVTQQSIAFYFWESSDELLLYQAINIIYRRSECISRAASAASLVAASSEEPVGHGR